MEAKKNPSKDVHRMRSMFFQIGLGISLIIVTTAFEWRTGIKKVSLRITDDPTVYELPVIPATRLTEPPPPSPIKREPIPIPSAVTTLVSFIASTTEEAVPDQPFVVDILSEPSGKYASSSDEPEIDITGFVLFPEKAAMPIGGYEGFYKMLRNHLKYPKMAQRQNVDGKVYVEFIVNRDGTPVDIKVFRGIGYGCDEEAMRVIGLSKWNPGKQRGKPVRVKMIMPIIFQLN
jgi:protein TonB